MKRQLLGALTLLAVVGLLAGCKVAVIVVEGGEVRSTGSGTCLAGTVCIHEVTDGSYTESFEAVPEAGWDFVKWNNGGDFLCEDQTDPICIVSTEGTDVSPAIQAIIASDKAYNIQPIFVEVGLDITDTVIAAGREWAQVNLFTGLSWNDINAVCPDGVCTGELNGYNVTNMIWASVDDVNALFNSYLETAGVTGADLLGPGPDNYGEVASSWAPALFSEFDASLVGGNYVDISAWTRETETDETLGHAVFARDIDSSSADDHVSTFGSSAKTWTWAARGAFLYRAQ